MLRSSVHHGSSCSWPALARARLGSVQDAMAVARVLGVMAVLSLWGVPRFRLSLDRAARHTDLFVAGTGTARVAVVAARSASGVARVGTALLRSCRCSGCQQHRPGADGCLQARATRAATLCASRAAVSCVRRFLLSLQLAAAAPLQHAFTHVVLKGQGAHGHLLDVLFHAAGVACACVRCGVSACERPVCSSDAAGRDVRAGRPRRGGCGGCGHQGLTQPAAPPHAVHRAAPACA